MRITVVGATGMVGSRIVAEAHSRRHTVTAVSRRGLADEASTVRSVAADASDPAAMAAVFVTADVVVGATRPARGPAADAVAVTTGLLAAAAAAQRRLVVIGGAGPLQVPGTTTLALDDPDWVPPAWRAFAAVSIDQLRICERHPAVDWTYISPPAVIAPGERTGTYRAGTTTLLTDGDGWSAISAEDFAVAVVDELEAASGQRRLTFAGVRP